MKTAAPQRPRLKSLDDLFQLNDGIVPQDQAVSTTNHQEKRLPSTIAIRSLTPFREHPFRLYTGERLDDMVESIKKNGILVPIIARRLGEVYEILSGHNRAHAADIAGLECVPFIALENISDEEAWVYVVETNLMQRSFSDMSHSEKAAVISVQHSKLFSPGKRNDILAELKTLENPHEHNENGTFPQVGERLHSDKRVGEMYSLSKNTVARYLRIHQLDAALKSLLDDGVIAFIPAVTLSFLRINEQQELARCIELNGFSADMQKADVLRDYSEKGKLDEENIYLILGGEIGKRPQPNRTPTVKVSKAVYSKYFRPDQPAKEVQEIVEKALKLFFDQI